MYVGVQPICWTFVTLRRYILVGNGCGKMAALDLRGGRLVTSFRDIAGSVRCIRCHPSEPLVVSCGLDRFLRMHHLHTKKLLRKVSACSLSPTPDD